MIAFWLLLLCAAGMALAQDLIPGQPIYHTGWYNALDVAILLIAITKLRSLRKSDTRTFRGLVAATFGCAIVVFAGVASGLMGPDAQTIVGAPGASVHNDDAGGSFVFPISGTTVALQRGNSSVSIGNGHRYTGGFVLSQTPRTVVYVEAYDNRGNRVTITQPTNASFLSPVLLMQQTTTIGGMNVRFDTFAVPALNRTVRAVLFSEQQAALLHADPPIIGAPAVLLAVSDNQDRMVRGGIGIVPSGGERTIGGLRFRTSVTTYPAVVVASAPYLPVLLLGLLAMIAGAIISRLPSAT